MATLTRGGDSRRGRIKMSISVTWWQMDSGVKDGKVHFYLRCCRPETSSERQSDTPKLSQLMSKQDPD